MSMPLRIPKRGKAGVAFMGVEFSNAWPLLLSIFVALITGGPLGGGAMFYLGVPVAGFFLNKMYVEVRSKQLPGAVREWLYSIGLSGYSSKITSQQVVFKGDNTVINPASTERLNHIVHRMQEHRKHNGTK